MKVLSYFKKADKNYIVALTDDNKIEYYIREKDGKIRSKLLKEEKDFFNKNVQQHKDIKKVEKKQNKKRILKLCKNATVAFFVGTIGLATISEMPNVFLKARREAFNNEKKEINYGYEKIEKAIDSNENLSDSEKSFIKKMKFVFDENYKYMNIDKIAERLKNLKINYNRENISEKDYIVGLYKRKDNSIEINKCSCFEDCDITVWMHEFLHVLQTDVKENNLLIELSEELFSRETTRKMYDNGDISEERLKNESNSKIINYGMGYKQCMPIYYILAEIISQDDLRKYQFSGDSNVIIDALVNCKEGYTADRSEADKFIENMNNAITYDNNNLYEIDYYNIYNTNKKLYENLKFYYKIKKGHDLEEDIKANIYYLAEMNDEENLIKQYCPYSDYIKNLIIKPILLDKMGKVLKFWDMEKIVTERTYLSDDHRNPSITFKDSKNITIEINDLDNEFFRKSYLKYKEEHENQDIGER